MSVSGWEAASIRRVYGVTRLSQGFLGRLPFSQRNVVGENRPLDEGLCPVFDPTPYSGTLTVLFRLSRLEERIYEVLVVRHSVSRVLGSSYMTFELTR